MLEHVTANQTRFVAPGLSPDARGVAVGRFCVVLLPSLDRVVGLFRGLSERGSLDDLLSSLKVYQVKTPLQSREYIVQLPSVSSHAADGLAAVAALMTGLTFTGSAKHFVRYRDGRSPLGYDVDSLHAGQGDFILYDTDFVQAYARERELAFPQLVLNLSLQLERNDQLLDGETALLRVVPGLWRAVLVYLHRNNCACEVAACEQLGDGTGPRDRFYLVRCTLQPRMEALFRRTPGIELNRLKTPQVAVQLGYRHPFELSACGNSFEEGHFYLFSGVRNSLDVMATPPTFVSASALVNLGDANRGAPAGGLTAQAPEPLRVPLRLVSSSGPRRGAIASRVAHAQAGWLKKLVYLLPPLALEQYSVCLTETAIYLHSEAGIQFIPLGDMFYQLAPGVLVQAGYELIPRFNPAVLVQHLGGAQGQLFFFSVDSPAPQLLSRSDFQPLTRRALATVPAQPAAVVHAQAAAPAGASLVNDPLGLFPLWGFSDGDGRKA
jgi:hypothetical protein